MQALEYDGLRLDGMQCLVNIFKLAVDDGFRGALLRDPKGYWGSIVWSHWLLVKLRFRNSDH